MEIILQWIYKNPILTALIVLVLFLIFLYNNLNGKKHRVERSFSTIDVYLQKRFDELSSLFEQTLKAYDHESDVYKEVSRLRSGIVKAQNGSINDKVEAENEIRAFVANPMIRTEAYPELESIRTIAMETANATRNVENELASARRQYNNNATSYNAKIKSFPTILFAGIFGFGTPFALFKADEEAKKRPSINNN